MIACGTGGGAAILARLHQDTDVGQDRHWWIAVGTLAMTLVLIWQEEPILDADPG